MEPTEHNGSNNVVPIALSFMLCDRVILDQMTGQHSVIGIVTQVHATKFPVRSPRLCMWAELVGGHGETPLLFEIVDVNEKRDPVMRTEVVMNFTDPLAVSQMSIVVPPLPFPEPGDYRVRLLSKGTYVVERRLLLNLVTPREH